MSKKIKKPVKLDLSFGSFTPEEFERPKFSFTKYPWPLKDESVDEIYSAYLMIRIPGNDRPAFMDEVYRVLVPKGKCTILVPYWTNVKAIQDFTHEWPPLAEQSFLYFNKEWREKNQIDYKMKSDFDFTYGYAFDPETMSRGDDTRPFWVKHYTNAITDLQINLTKK